MAILLVILFHYGYLGFGWVGVQLFFVLSGYLITSILVSERGRPLGESLKRFYWRRSLRIVPLYCLYLLALLTTFLFLKVPPALADQWPYLLTYTYNVRHILPDYDGSQFLIHLWSLSVEEQFYLVWPITVLLLAPRRFKFALIGIVILVPLIRLIAALFLLSHGQPQLFVGTVMYTITPFQIDAFATGAIVATFRLEKIRMRKGLLYVGLALAVAMGVGQSIHISGSLFGSRLQFRFSHTLTSSLPVCLGLHRHKRLSWTVNSWSSGRSWSGGFPETQNYYFHRTNILRYLRLPPGYSCYLSKSFSGSRSFTRESGPVCAIFTSNSRSFLFVVPDF